MMYMDDAINATIGIMQPESLPSYISYNLGAFSFSPHELAEAIKNKIPEFTISYNPDARQEIARTWPQSIDDSMARNDWGWEPTVGLEEMVDVMLQGLHYNI